MQKVYEEIKTDFLNQIKDKKGILFFDMDQTIYDFLRYKEEYCEYNNDTVWQTSTKYFTGKMRQGINQKVIDYLHELKSNYVLISNTSWGRDGIQLIPGMEKLFDFYGNGHGFSISNNTCEELQFFDIPNFQEVTDLCDKRGSATTKANVNEFFYKILNDSDLDINNYRVVQFEDTMTGTKHITDFVLLTRGFRYEARNFINGLDTVYTNPKNDERLKLKRIDDEKIMYNKLNINFWKLPLGIHADGVITWCEEHLNK